MQVGQQVNDGLLLVPEEEDEEVVDPKGKGKAREGKKVGGEQGGRTKAALAWVQRVLDLKDKFDTLLAKAFGADKAFEKSINDVRSRWLWVRGGS